MNDASCDAKTLPFFRKAGKSVRPFTPPPPPDRGIAGVGEVNIWGASCSLRIWLDPSKMAQYGLMPSDIAAVLAEQNVESPTGTLGAE